jgi:hydroxypyruvate isomerase
MKTNEKWNRRTALKSMAAGAASLAIGNAASAAPKNEEHMETNLKGNINHSVCKWCFGNIPLEEFAPKVKSMGLMGIDLIGPDGWDVLKANGLESTMCNGAELNLVDGFNDPKFHDALVKRYEEHIDLVAKAGFKNLICFSGNRRGMDNEVGLKNCITGLKRILGRAEKRGVVLHMELLNSKVDHKDYMCDKSDWGIALCKALDSDNFKLLYDIYHMQIDEGDVIRTIQESHQYFGHYHTAGVPGRHEIEEEQELYYPAIMRAIVATGFKGVVAQEFIPANKTNKGLDSLAKAVSICDV